MTLISLRHFAKITLLFVFNFLATFLLSTLAQETPKVPKTAVQEYKNIQALKEIPADQLIPTMQFIGGALGVARRFFPVEQRNENEQQQKKQTAPKIN